MRHSVTRPEAMFETPPAATIELTPFARAQFVRSVQPMLIHSCGTAGCHQAGESVPMALDRMAIVGAGNPAAIEGNLQTVLSDAFSYGSSLRVKSVRWFILLVMLIGAGIALKYGRLPLELIVFAQGVTVTIAPLIGGAMLIIANDRKVMGNLRNDTMQNLNFKVDGKGYSPAQVAGAFLKSQGLL